MGLSEDIEDIKTKITNGYYRQETDIVDAIVKRLLQTLGWPLFDTHIIAREYNNSGDGRPDLALFHPTGRPIIVIEAKYISRITDDSKEQLFRYVLKEGFPIAILTDGNDWHFYLPSGQGKYEERNFCSINLVEDDTEYCSNVFKKYMDYNDCVSGKSIDVAQSDYKTVQNKRRIQETLPAALLCLISEKSPAQELLLEYLSEKVKEIVGVIPDNETVLDFLNAIIPDDTQGEIIPSPQNPSSSISKTIKTQSIKEYSLLDERHAKTEIVSFIFENNQYDIIRKKGWKEFYVKMCKLLLQKDRSKFISSKLHPDTIFVNENGRKRDRTIVAGNGDNLTRGEQLLDSLWIETNFNPDDICELLKCWLKYYGLSKNSVKIILR
ncbi:hypothetical protein FACS1894109_19290 [Spirochaetia bacterium]|nr:hypothetical protein FACS1894109_19290 [Spirochaetia bacterium]